MKNFMVIVALVLSACGKQNDVPILEKEAVTLVKHYQPKVEKLLQRLDELFKKGERIPDTVPAVQDVALRWAEARDLTTKLNGIVGKGPDGKSAVEKQAEALAKENKVEDLRKLVHDTRVTLENGITAIQANLGAVESWIAQYDRQAMAMPEEETDPTDPPAPAPAPAPGAAQPTPAQPVH